MPPEPLKYFVASTSIPPGFGRATFVGVVLSGIFPEMYKKLALKVYTRPTIQKRT